MPLASIQEIKSIKPAKNSDNLEVAEVKGFQAVVQKGKHYEGERIVFIEIDSIVPEWPEYSFLKGNRVIKTIPATSSKLRGNLSQGLVMNIKDYYTTRLHDVYRIGFDLTKVLQIQKYEKPAPKCQDAAGPFPECVSKTDEVNIQSEPGLIGELGDHQYYVTQKADGCSMTAIKTFGYFGVCSRNLELKPGNNVYWNMAEKYKLKDIMKNNIAIQGEIVGPGIQKNPMGLKENIFLVFDVYDTDSQKYYDFLQLVRFVRTKNLPMVKVLAENIKLNTSVRELIETAKIGKYHHSGKPQEGIVVRPMGNVFSKTLRKRLSFKVLNPDYKE